MKSTSERILDAAEHEFARKGYDATSLADIAAVVEIRVPSLYKHFTSKRDLYLAVAKRLLDPYVELLHGVLDVPTDAATAERNLLLVATHYLQTPNLARLVQHAALAGGEALDLLVEHWHGPLFERATELTGVDGSPQGDPAIALVVTFHSLISGYVTMANLHARLTGTDPLAAPAIAAQLQLMSRLTGGLWSKAAAAPAAAPTKAPTAAAKLAAEPPARAAGRSTPRAATTPGRALRSRK